MKKTKLIEELRKYPIFTIKILKEIINKNKKYAKLVLHRMKKETIIFKVEKNKYTLHKDPFIIATNLIWPSYISCWSALRYHSLTEQLPQNISVITSKSRKKRTIEFMNTKINLLNLSPKHFFGYNKERYNDTEIFIADKEKALIDSALLKKASLSEIYEIINSNKESIDFDLLTNYLIKIKNKTLIKRFGYLLDKININTKRLIKLIDSKYIPLDYALKAKGTKNKKWKVIENVKL